MSRSILAKPRQCKEEFSWECWRFLSGTCEPQCSLVSMACLCLCVQTQCKEAQPGHSLCLSPPPAEPKCFPARPGCRDLPGAGASRSRGANALRVPRCLHCPLMDPWAPPGTQGRARLRKNLCCFHLPPFHHVWDKGAAFSLL